MTHPTLGALLGVIGAAVRKGWTVEYHPEAYVWTHANTHRGWLSRELLDIPCAVLLDLLTDLMNTRSEE